jgi:DNA repair protein RadC
MTISLSEDQKIKILNSDDVYSVLQNILLREEKIDQEKEHFWMVGLAQNNRILYIELVSMGSVKATTVEPMNVFRVAVLKGAVNVILAHNHPSGELKPSDADKDLTDRLIQVGLILNIKVIDHLVISVKSYLSFGDTGLLAELELSTKWVPQYQLIERIKKEEKKIRDEALKLEREKAKEDKAKAVKKKAIDIAKGLKKDGVALEIIIKNTGLTKDEIEKIKL